MDGLVRMIVVDDEPLARRKLRNFAFEEHGYVIVGEAENGKQGIELVRQLEPDIVLADIGMPVMDGLEMLKQLKMGAVPPKVLLLTCYEDFEKACMALKYGAEDYIPKALLTENDLIQTLERIKSIVLKEREDQYIRLCDYLRKCIIEQDDQNMNLLLKELQFNPRFYYLIKIKHNEDFAGLIHKIVGLRKGLNCPLLYAAFPISTHAFCLLFYSAPDQKQDAFTREIFLEASSIFKAISEYGKHPGFVMAVSHIHYHITQLPLAYQECRSLCENGFYLNDRQLMLPDKKSNFMELSTDEVARWRNELFKAFQSYEKRQITEWISKWIHMLKGSPCIHPLQVIHITEAVAAIYIYQSIDLEDRGQPVQLHIWLKQKLEAVVHVSEIINSLQRVSDTIEHLSDVSAPSTRTEIKEAIHFIHKHYSNIELNDVANHVNLSPSWFASLFRKEFGKNFHEYLQYYRLQVARQLLFTTDCKVYEIAERVGIPNARYFSKLFAEVYGVPPMDYRKQRLKT